MSTSAPRAVRPLYARTVRRGSGGPGLLLAHGGGGSVADNFGPILDRLAAAHTVVGVDYPGTGGTPRATEPLRLDDLADQLVAAADAEGLERFAVLGYSLGGNVAVRIAARYPERVSALVLTATFARAGRGLGPLAGLWAELGRRGEDELLARLLVPLAFSEEQLEALDPDGVEGVVRAMAATIPPGSGDHAALVGAADLRGDLAGLDVPALVVVTTGDRLVPPALQRELAAALPGARVAELAAGHLPFAERPAEWAALVEEFLAG
ncbi:alpha/beta fold hydrolase [Streptomyces sp. NPDC057939]|uniref:alpha/beta fold hydrolase n=1 Tax=Streptomyces sp. NPDC057939 TaxID=3346284 RepID=UPI0036EE9AB5